MIMKLYLLKARKPKRHKMEEVGLFREDQIEQAKVNYFIDNDLLENGVPKEDVVFEVLSFDVDTDNSSSDCDKHFTGSNKKKRCAELYNALVEYHEMDLEEIKNDIRQVSKEHGQVTLAELTGINFNSIVGYKRKQNIRPPFESYIKIMSLKK